MEEILANIGFFLELWMIQIYVAMVWRTKFCFRPFSCFLFVWNAVVATAVNFGPCPPILLWTTHLFLVLYFCRRFRRKWKENVVRFGIVILLTGITEILAALLELMMHYIIDLGEWRFVAVNAIGVLIAVGSYLAIKADIGRFTENINKIYQLGVVCITPMFIMIFDYYENHQMKLMYDLIIFMIIIIVILYFNRVQHVENLLRQKEMEYEMRNVYGKIYKDAIDDMRRRQHSYKNQLLALSGTYRAAESMEQLVQLQEEYCTALQEDSRYDAVLMKCSDSVMSGFLYYKCIACEEQGIRVEYDIVAGELKCVVLVHELVEIIGILMDNACEKVLEYEEPDRVIYLRLTEHAEAVELEVANRSERLLREQVERLFENGYSTKGSERGLGLARVKQIADKYNLDIQVENQEINKKNRIVFRLVIKK